MFFADFCSPCSFGPSPLSDRINEMGTGETMGKRAGSPLGIAPQGSHRSRGADLPHVARDKKTGTRRLVTNVIVVAGSLSDNCRESYVPNAAAECPRFEPLMRRILLPRRRGAPFWPAKLAGDKGFSYPHIRRWLRRHHIEPVIPTRKNQPRKTSSTKPATAIGTGSNEPSVGSKNAEYSALDRRNWLWITSPCG
jgi:hypothetical protein